jgi:hypothetical protein
MPLTRRALLGGLAAASLAPAPFARASGEPAFVAAAKGTAGYEAAILDADGRILFTGALDDRGHDCAVAPDGGTVVLFERRPGRFAVVLDLNARRRTGAFEPPADRTFAGHGFFSPDGRLLYATEEDFAAERGVIGVYDVAAGWRRVGELPTHGMGVHEALLLPDGRTIAVANGGILTDPAFPRLKLNLPTMDPSFTLVDAQTGDLVGGARPPASLHQLSIRHLAAVGGREVWFGGQYEGPEADMVPLVGVFSADRLTLVEADESVTRGLAQYVGSVASSADGARVVVTSPPGGTVVTFDVASHRVLEAVQLADAGGVAPSGDGFLVTAGDGTVLRAGGHAAGARHRERLAWDNHVRAIRA